MMHAHTLCFYFIAGIDSIIFLLCFQNSKVRMKIEMVLFPPSKIVFIESLKKTLKKPHPPPTPFISFFIYIRLC